MSPTILILCFIFYLLMVVYIQYDNGGTKLDKAFFNVFIGPFVYPLGIVILLIAHSYFFVRDKLVRKHVTPQQRIQS